MIRSNSKSPYSKHSTGPAPTNLLAMHRPPPVHRDPREARALPPAPASARHAGAGRSRRPHTKAASPRSHEPRRRPRTTRSVVLRLPPAMGDWERRPRKVDAGGAPARPCRPAARTRSATRGRDAFSPAWGLSNRRGIRTAHRLVCSGFFVESAADALVITTYLPAQYTCVNMDNINFIWIYIDPSDLLFA
jgi:hypothetical protein